MRERHQDEAPDKPGHDDEDRHIHGHGPDLLGIAGDQAGFFADPDGDESDQEDFDHIIKHPRPDDVVAHFGPQELELVEDRDDHRLGRGHPSHPDDKSQGPAVPQPKHHSHSHQEGNRCIEYRRQNDLAALATHLLHIDLQTDEKEEEKDPKIGQDRKDLAVDPFGEHRAQRCVVNPHRHEKRRQDPRDLEPLQETGQEIAQAEHQRKQQQKFSQNLIVHFLAPYLIIQFDGTLRETPF